MGDHTARLTNVYQAKLAEQAERYDDMVESMKKVASMGLDLTVEERNLTATFPTAYPEYRKHTKMLIPYVL